jgi:hypothetical protein
MKLNLIPGTAYTIKDGKRIAVTEIEAQSSNPCDSCKLDCCKNQILMKATDADDSTVKYPYAMEVIVSGVSVILRITIDLGSGPIVKEVTLT